MKCASWGILLVVSLGGLLLLVSLAGSVSDILATTVLALGLLDWLQSTSQTFQTWSKPDLEPGV